MLYSSDYDSPYGKLKLIASERGIRAVLFLSSDVDEGEEPRVLNPQAVPVSETIPDDDRLAEIKLELNKYFAKETTTFSTPIDFGDAGTPFQRQVWEHLREIPYGEISSYGDLATKLGNPRAARGVGLANNRNPLPIFVPCHRVIGANGSLVGYAGGVDFKQSLLKLEGVPLKSDASSSTTRDHILKAAIDEFSEHTYSNANIDRIAKNAGVNKRMIYHHFRSKEALYKKIVNRDESIRVDMVAWLKIASLRVLEADFSDVNQMVAGVKRLENLLTSPIRDKLGADADATIVFAWLLHLGNHLQRAVAPAKPDALEKLMTELLLAVEKYPREGKSETSSSSEGIEEDETQRRERIQAVVKRILP